MLLTLVILYLLVTVAIGLYAATRVKSSADFAVAGRSLPLIMIVTTTFATWFGSETVLGISARFVKGGLNSVIEDPFGASMCLVLVGLFFAYRLYNMTLITIGDYYRKRFGPGIEIFCSIVIILSYLGWVAAQITALGLVFNLVSGGAVTAQGGMVLGTLIVLLYTVFGGMFSVAWTDFLQMTIIVIGLLVIAVMAGNQAGGADKVFALAQQENWFRFWPEPKAHDIVFFFAAGITMMLGSIPQQDVFQRVMSAKDADTARKGPIIGGLSYLAFAFVPMFIVATSLLIMPDEANKLLADDPQKVLPTLIMGHMPLIAQVFFFGALISAIMSTASATLLAPSTTFTENILKHLVPHMGDKQVLRALRISLIVFAALVLSYSLAMQGTSIYELVSSAYQVTLVGAFVPLAFGLYWKRATTQGAVMSIALGIGVWLMFFPQLTNWGDAFPGQLAGLLAALVGMVAGSLGPQLMRNRHAVHELVGLKT
ncbi:sodium:solute symporter family protein [Piscinibacter sp.]|jgi:SSS family transporter|uniref:sodium:solute symporter family protein n=1 Tax=Piscinibacter sp. TaxID=1903157 RepID=UPI002F40BB22